MDKTKPVLVTGATGYVAGWLVKKLLEEGFTVHAAVRNPDDKKKVQHLTEISNNSAGSIKFFKSDLLKNGSYKEAMMGCEVVFHTASPFSTNVKNPQKDLIEPAVKGTQNILLTANEVETVKRIVVTSSCAAIYCDASDCKKASNGILTEEDWNTTASLSYQPYSYSKTLAEKKAWELEAQQSRWDLVTINPSFVLGPMLNPLGTTSESFDILKQMGDGSFKMGAPKMGIGVVDVRDVAEAHFQAGFNENAKGRYLTSAHNTNFFDMAQTLVPTYGKSLPIPKKVLPKWFLMIFGPLANKLFTWKFIRNNIDVVWKADNSKIKSELGIKFIPLEKTMNDSFEVLVNAGVLKGK